MTDDLPSPLPYDAQAALLFVDGGLMLHYRTPANGVAVKPLALNAVRAAFSRVPVDSGWLPAEIRRCGITEHGPFAVAAIPAARHPLKVQLPDHRRLQRLDVPLPPVVMVGLGRQYMAWALLEQFEPSALLANIPLPNIHQHFDLRMGGGICWGANQPDEATPTGVIRAWQTFTRTPFNDHLIAGKSQAYPNDVRLALLAASTAEHYPLDDLVPLEMTVAQALSGCLNLSGGPVPAVLNDDDP